MDESKINEFYDIIKKSGEFDYEYYINKYPEIKEQGIDPIIHFITIGIKKMYNPSETFNSYYYVNFYKDIRKRVDAVGFDNFNPLVHYILYGKNEKRNPTLPKELSGVNISEFIDNPDLLASKLVIDNINTNRLINNYEKQFDSINHLMNLIFSNYDIKAKGLLRYNQLLALELVRIFDMICKKHDIKYWLDYGTLLGAVRHGGFIPWDDDMDIGMMRKDFIKFLSIFDEELSNYSLSDKIKINYYKNNDEWNIKKYFNNNFLLLFAQVILIKPVVKFDIFIYDYVEDDAVDANYFNFYKRNKQRFISEVKNKKCTPEVGTVKYNDILKVTDDETKWVINSIDSYPDYRLIESKDIFELDKIKFEDYIFNCPKNPKNYLPHKYGDDFMVLPKILIHHNRVHHALKHFKSENDAIFSYKKALIELKSVY